MLGINQLKLYHLIFLFFFFVFSGKAQNEIGSPYSAYGLGYLSNANNFRIMSMGNTGIGSRENYNVNIDNPASYTAIDTTSFLFEGGLFAKYTRLKAKGIDEDATTASLGHLLMGFPLNRWWKSSVSMVPYSTVGYSVTDYDYVDDIGSILYEYKGIGGISRVNWGNAIQPFKFLSVGVNTSYLFGTIDRSQKITFPDSLYMIKTKINNSVSTGDFYFDFGLQYFTELKKDIKLVVGAAYHPKVNVNAKKEYIARNFIVEANNDEKFQDTIAYTSYKGTIIFPSGYGLGVSLAKTDHWFFGVDYKFDNWQDYRSFGASDSLVNSRSIAMGGRLVPDFSSTSYLSRIDYRIGAKYYESYLKLRGKQLNGFGITFGFGLPIRSLAIKGTKSMINLGFEIGRRGTLEQNLIRENYANFFFGVTIYETWFFKRRYK
jgi:hypothetical protein